MNIKIRNYRGLKSADIVWDKICLIFGKNGAGKTSLVDAVRSVLTAKPCPFPEITKKQLSMLIHSGTAQGFCELESDEWGAKIEWPGDYKTTGIPPVLSHISAGLTSMVDMRPADRMNYITELMKSEPTYEDLRKELYVKIFYPEKFEGLTKKKLQKAYNDLISVPENLGPEKHILSLWDQLEINDFDILWKLKKTKGAEMKGAWQHVTGRPKYGINIANAWAPEEYHDNIDLVSLTAELEEKNEWLEAAIKNTAVSASETDRLTILSNKLPDLKKEADQLKLQHDTIETEYNKLLKNPSGEQRGLLCPSCHKILTLSDGKLKLLPKSEGSKALGETQQKQSDIKSLKTQTTDILKKWGDVNGRIKESKAAKAELSKAAKPGECDEKTIDEIKLRIETIKNEIASVEKYNEAKKLQKNIQNNKILCDILSPSGLRLSKLKKSLDFLNKNLKLLCDVAEWPTVEISEDCTILWKGQPYSRFMAKSERYRTRVLLQLIVAMQEKSEYIIIDDLDELTPELRGKMMRAISKTTIPALVVCAQDGVPEKFNGYVVEKGVVNG